jgi:hypothetical protein
MLFSVATAWADFHVLYDDTHGQTAGNADWTINGAYSEMADLLKANGFVIDSLKAVAPDRKITHELLSKYQALILAEPNNPYNAQEMKAIVDFVKNGGGAFLIGDHGGADRDNDGWDAVKAINAFSSALGFKYTGDTFSEAPVRGTFNKEHPATYGIRAIGAWAASTILPVDAPNCTFTELIGSRTKKGAYLAAIEVEKGRVIVLGDSSPFDDGVGSGGKKALHDSYDSFMYSHPQMAYNAMKWVTGQKIDKRIPSRVVAFAPEAKVEEKAVNLLIDAAHGNAASDKMETYERHMKKLGVKVFYGIHLITPDMLSKFSAMILPSPSLPLIDSEMQAISDWLMAGGRLLVTSDWDSSDLAHRDTLNTLMGKLGSVMRFNSDQVWDQTNKTNKPWGVLAHVLHPTHPAMKGVKTVITWGTCTLITRDKQPLTDKAGVTILITGDDDSFNKDGDKKNDAVLYPKGTPVVMMAEEKLANGVLVALGCSNFTDYQYPDSDINMNKPGPAPFTHETPAMHDNLITDFLGANLKAGVTRQPAKPRRGR